MELLNQELQLQSGEADVTRGLLALNVAQDYFESLAALRPEIFGSSTGTITTTVNVETTAMPTGLLRLDRIQLLDSNSKPVRDIEPLNRVGGHIAARFWPENIVSSTGSGSPVRYKNYGGSIYWQPLPDATHTIRWYGFQAASAITASGTFAYPDILALPFASFACQLMKSGVDDDPKDVQAIAMASFTTALDTLSLINRDGGRGLAYTQVHTE